MKGAISGSTAGGASGEKKEIDINEILGLSNPGGGVGGVPASEQRGVRGYTTESRADGRDAKGGDGEDGGYF